MFAFIWAVIVGFFIGLFARFLMPGRDPMGFILTALLGIAGSVTATWLGQQMHWYPEGHAAGFIASILGAMLLLFAYRLVVSRTA